jgi:hypothetical protein
MLVVISADNNHYIHNDRPMVKEVEGEEKVSTESGTY